MSNNTTFHEEIEFGTLDIINEILIFIIMVGVGASLDVQKAKKHIKDKVAIGLGLFNHIILMPFLLWSFSQMDPHVPSQFRYAMIVLGTVPGGVLSNVICMWLHADPSLSITLTTITDILALGSMPLNTFIYLELAGVERNPIIDAPGEGGAASFPVHVDWVGLGASFGAIVGGNIVGMALQKCFQSHMLKRIEMICLLMAIPQAAIALSRNASSGAPVWAMRPGSVYVLLFGPTCIAFVWTTLFGRFVLKLPKPSCTAASVEASLQNVNIAIGVLSLSIRNEELRAQALGIPLAYATVTLIESIVFGLILWKAGWTELDPRGTNPCTVWFSEYRQAFRRNHESKTVEDIASLTPPPEADHLKD